MVEKCSQNTELHNTISQKTVVFIVTAVRISVNGLFHYCTKCVDYRQYCFYYYILQQNSAFHMVFMIVLFTHLPNSTICDENVTFGLVCSTLNMCLKNKNFICSMPGVGY